MIEAVNQIRSHLDLIDSAYKLVKFVLSETRNSVKKVLSDYFSQPDDNAAAIQPVRSQIVSKHFFSLTW